MQPRQRRACSAGAKDVNKERNESRREGESGREEKTHTQDFNRQVNRILTRHNLEKQKNHAASALLSRTTTSSLAPMLETGSLASLLC